MEKKNVIAAAARNGLRVVAEAAAECDCPCPQGVKAGAQDHYCGFKREYPHRWEDDKVQTRITKVSYKLAICKLIYLVHWTVLGSMTWIRDHPFVEWSGGWSCLIASGVLVKLGVI